VDAQWLSERLNEEKLVVLDVRSGIDNGGDRSSFQKSHIPGSVYSNYTNNGWRETRAGVAGLIPPVRSLERLIGSLGIANSSIVVLIPAGTGPTDFGSAARVYWTFKVLGHESVTILNGGLAGWKVAGYEVAEGAPAPWTISVAKPSLRPLRPPAPFPDQRTCPTIRSLNSKTRCFIWTRMPLAIRSTTLN